MTSSLWSLSQLEELTDHPEPSVQEWAVSKLFRLYPEEAESRLSRLLSDDRPTIVVATLERLENFPREGLIPLLRELFLTGSEVVSARAIYVLGDWKCTDAVSWIRERILEKSSLKKQQIAAIIHALGHIPTEDAYTLLKQTEKAIREKDSSFWNLFYASLLLHRRAEDTETLLNTMTDETQKEERRRDALGLLLSQTDSGLNPTDVFFNNHVAVRDHFLKRLSGFEREVSFDASDLLVQIFRDLISELAPDRISASLNLLERSEDAIQGISEYEEALYRHSLAFLKQAPASSDHRYGLACMAVSALLLLLERKIFPTPSTNAAWKEKLEYLLRDRPPRPDDEAYEVDILRESDRTELISLLTASLRSSPESLGALRAVSMLGRLKAVETSDLLLEGLRKVKDRLFSDAVHLAWLRMGTSVVPGLLPLLDSSDPLEQLPALDVLSQLPTQEGVHFLLSRLPSLYEANPEGILKVLHETGAKEFLPFLEKEYRQGEWTLGKVYVHLCRVNGLQTERLREIGLDVKQGDALLEANRRAFMENSATWPSVVPLELACKRCGKAYQYEVHEVHFHPHQEDEKEDETDFTPYKHGIVICDDLRCKNCGTLNELELTPKTLRQLTAESLKLLALQRMNRPIPSHYPVKHLRLDEKDGKPLTLPDMRQRHLDLIRHKSSAPGPHVALAKFYEYVKDYSSARYAYLRALDLDTRAVEAMAGLARLSYTEGNLQEAVDWIQSCYENLDKGNIYVTEEINQFKKTVRQKRNEFSRELGIKPEDKPVEIRFRMDTSEYPKNKPCPCGSGKKYKLCCMKKG